MGYRSEVAYVIGFDDDIAKEEFIALVAVHDDEHVRNALSECETRYTQPIITFHAQDVKWYPSYPDVQGHEELLRCVTKWCEGKAGWVKQELGEDGEESYDSSNDTTMDLDQYIFVRHSMELDFPKVLSDVNRSECNDYDFE